MQKRLLVIGSVLALFTACTPSAPTCDPARCDGCCDPHGVCQPGNTIDACGGKGLICNTCAPAHGQVCAETVCTVPMVDAGPVPGWEVGTGDRSFLSVDMTVIATSQQGLKRPTDLAFNPLRPDELWVVNSADDSVLIVSDASTAARTSQRRQDGYAVHFMARPAALAFGGSLTTIGAPGTFATCQESRNTYGGAAAPNDFMGVSLWSSDLSVFAQTNPNGLGSHLDMLHTSPLCMGLAHEAGNIYWAFGGLSNSIVKNDFVRDDGIGNDDHSDGEAYQYLTGQLSHMPGVPSHLAYSPADGSLFIADTGNARLLKLDTRSGTRGQALPSLERMAAHVRIDNATATELVTSQSGLLRQPSGLELKDGLLYVSDNATSRISVFTLDGALVNYLDTGLPAGALAGMAFGPDGKLYLVDMVDHTVLRIDPR